MDADLLKSVRLLMSHSLPRAPSSKCHRILVYNPMTSSHKPFRTAQFDPRSFPSRAQRWPRSIHCQIPSITTASKSPRAHPECRTLWRRSSFDCNLGTKERKCKVQSECLRNVVLTGAIHGKFSRLFRIQIIQINYFCGRMDLSFERTELDGRFLSAGDAPCGDWVLFDALDKCARVLSIRISEIVFRKKESQN